MRNIFAKFALLVVILSSVSLLRAQDSSSMTGVVSDTTGALVPGAVVTLTNPSTGTTYTKTTDNLGSYRFAAIPAGTGYKLTITHEGFSTAQVSDITLNVGVPRTQNVVLSVGGESQTIAVSAGNETVTLNTTDATIGNNIDVHELNDLPVYDRTRGISTLMYQQPGVDINQGSVTGARIDQSEVTVDGLDVDDQATGETFYLTTPAPVDSISQFTGSVAGLTPGIGTGSGGQFQLATTNGTNKFHGNLNEYNRNTDVVANTWFNNLIGLPRTPLIRNQFGGNLGGPIKRDKLFFFFNWAQSRIVQSRTSEPTVPLPASYGGFLAGNLNYINSSSAACGDSSRVNTQQSCISTLTPAEIQALDPGGAGLDPNMISFIKARYPAANDLSRGDGVNTGGYRFTYPSPDNNISYIGRIDYNLTSTQKIFGRFTIQREDAIESAPEFPTDPVTHPFQDRSYAYVVSHEWTIGKNKTNTAYYGDQISKLNFPDLYNPLGAEQPSISALSGPYTSFDAQKRRFPIPVVRDDFAWQKGNHNFVFGGTFKWEKNNSDQVTDFNFPGIGLLGSALQGGLDDDVRPSAATGYAPAAQINEGPNSSNNVAINDYDTAFATGLGVIGDIYTNYSYNNKGVALPAGAGQPRAYRFYQTEAYFGDTWKLNSKLTMTYGVRYQLYSVPYETKGFESVPTPIPFNTFVVDRLQQQNSGNTSNTGLPFYSEVLGGKANNGPALYQPNYKDFAPRVGLAWTPWADGKTVFNFGGGIYYDRNVIDAIDFLQDQISFLFFNQTENQFGSSAGPDASLAADPRVGSNLSYPASKNPAPQAVATPYTPYVDSTGTPFGLAAGETGFVISPTLKDPYSIAFNFGVQQQLPGHLILKANYVGRLGRRLLADADANQVIDVPDYTHQSTQSMSQAFAGLTSQLRAGKDYTNVTPQPWFEDVLNPIFGPGNSTSAVAYYTGQLAERGDIADTLYTMASYAYYYFGVPWLPNNIGIPAQFGTNAYLTNMGNSNYHGMLVTLDKNISNGLRFEFNYTWSHSIDNTSVSANSNALFTNSNFICDIMHPRACRGDSDFDIRQEISSNFAYQLPFGRGKEFGGSMAKGWDEAVGGWEISAIPDYRTGLPQSATADAYLASFDNLDNAIFIGTSKSALKSSVNVDHTSNTVYLFPGGSAGAQKVLSQFRGPLGIEYGQRNLIRGPGGFFLDGSLGKKFPLFEGVDLNFHADAFNVLNHPVFGNGSMDIVNSASNFGQITGTVDGLNGVSARVAQFSLRLDF